MVLISYMVICNMHIHPKCTDNANEATQIYMCRLGHSSLDAQIYVGLDGVGPVDNKPSTA